MGETFVIIGGLSGLYSIILFLLCPLKSIKIYLIYRRFIKVDQMRFLLVAKIEIPIPIHFMFLSNIVL